MRSGRKQRGEGRSGGRDGGAEGSSRGRGLLAEDAAGAEVAGGVVGSGEAVDFDAAAGCVDEGDFSADWVGVDGDGHVAYTA